jgi:bifunctional DNA-binding transcriptional regulator/antitoxin component of YhaV-PrlF toxin-antitoxin module
MIKTQYSRKLDPTGRLVIPSKLREKLNLKIGDSYDFFLCEVKGRQFLCIECPRPEAEIEKALKVLRDNGFEVTKSADSADEEFQD